MTETNAAIAELAATMTRWRADGTFDRMQAAFELKTPVLVQRSSGAMQEAVIVSFGHGGMSCNVAWGDRVGRDRVHFPPGVAGKFVKATDLVRWNPWLLAGTVMNRTLAVAQIAALEAFGCGCARCFTIDSERWTVFARMHISPCRYYIEECEQEDDR